MAAFHARPFALTASDGASIYVRFWPAASPPRGALLIVHGLAEHGGRYAELAEVATASGHAVFALDLRGHGATAPTHDELGFFAARDGWRLCLDDLARLRQRIEDEYPGVPVTMLGHSMGSLLAQDFAGRHGEGLAGLVLSGASGKPTFMARVGRLIARMERLRLGPRGRSALVQALSFGAFNRAFAPTRTPADWLSRDMAEVDRYLADPLCGFRATTQLWVELLDAVDDVMNPAGLTRWPKSLPILLLAGARDPVSENARGVRDLAATYAAAGLQRVALRIDADARHELLHETHRAEVIRDVVAWMTATTERR